MNAVVFLTVQREVEVWDERRSESASGEYIDRRTVPPLEQFYHGDLLLATGIASDRPIHVDTICGLGTHLKRMLRSISLGQRRHKYELGKNTDMERLLQRRGKNGHDEQKPEMHVQGILCTTVVVICRLDANWRNMLTLRPVVKEVPPLTTWPVALFIPRYPNFWFILVAVVLQKASSTAVTLQRLYRVSLEVLRLGEGLTGGERLSEATALKVASAEDELHRELGADGTAYFPAKAILGTNANDSDRSYIQAAAHPFPSVICTASLLFLCPSNYLLHSEEIAPADFVREAGWRRGNANVTTARTGLELKQPSYEDKAVHWMCLEHKDLCRKIQHIERGYRSGRRPSVDADETEIFTEERGSSGGSAPLCGFRLLHAVPSSSSLK
ncbi:hypothetical protein ARMGADRAFT_1062448 [Armillaria gallica]|uniref:Uncharacterized protein n=1 Tax=Armillaria gallica TaxID=47427 RepID=A0A2H3DLD7_ARMGA|nr:hypothetical protein ARMGADRAFT_1062448 [Armillaria gallica]